MDKTTVSVLDFGAVGDGYVDDHSAFQAALDSGASIILIPFGTYKITKALKISSNTEVVADKCAKIKFSPKERCKRGDFLLTNKNTEYGDENISIFGGIWDGSNSIPETDKPDIFDKTGYSGSMLNFFNVSRLCLKSMVLANSTTYYVRMSKIKDFEIEDIDFVSDRYGYNQDGLHFGGEVKNGRVKNIRALSFGQTNDDMIALNADDSVERVENLDIVRGDIENISFENIYAENCYTIVRMLSVTAKIRNVSFKNIYAGYRNYAVNMDGARYCKTPLFKESDVPFGVGFVENIKFDNFVCYPVNEPIKSPHASLIDPTYALRIETNCKNFEINGFKKLGDFEKDGTHALFVTNVHNCSVTADGKEYLLKEKSDKLLLDGFTKLKI